MRLVTGTRGSEPAAANAELKCFDLSANPYLLVGAVTAVVCASFDRGGRLHAQRVYLLDDPGNV